MKKPGSVTQQLDQLRSEDAAVRNEAANVIWKRYCNVLLDLACRHLDQRLRRRVGADDIVQRTFKSFFLRQRRGEFDLADRSDLLGLLVRMTLNKVGHAATCEGRQRRDFRRDRPAAASDGGSGEEDGWVLEQARQGPPTPDQAAALAEEVERRLGQLPDDLRRIALWKLEGYTNAEIAGLPEMSCSIRSVERKLRLIREAWGEPS